MQKRQMATYGPNIFIYKNYLQKNLLLEYHIQSFQKVALRRKAAASRKHLIVIIIWIIWMEGREVHCAAAVWLCLCVSAGIHCNCHNPKWAAAVLLREWTSRKLFGITFQAYGDPVFDTQMILSEVCIQQSDGVFRDAPGFWHLMELLKQVVLAAFGNLVEGVNKLFIWEKKNLWAAGGLFISQLTAVTDGNCEGG